MVAAQARHLVLQLPASVEHVRHRRRLPGLPAPMDRNAMPELQRLVRAFRLVRILTQINPDYLTDASGFTGWADDVRIPAAESEVLQVLQEAREHGTAVTIAGAGSGLTGARVAQGGIVLSLEKFRSLDICSGSARAGTAVTLLDLDKA